MEAQARYLVEITQPDSGWRALQEMAARARSAAREMRTEGTSVRLIRSVYAPEDDLCFFLYEAPSAEVVELVVTRAGLGFDHVVKASRDGSEAGRGGYE